jgi:hypothetical protein
MKVYEWSAGTAEGVTSDKGRARETAAAFMRSTGTDTGVVRQAYHDPGRASSAVGYRKPADAPSWAARLQADGTVTWRRCTPALKHAAA